MTRKQIGAMLLEAGLINQSHLNEALAKQKEFQGRLASWLLRIGAADERSLAMTLSHQLGVPFAVLSRCEISAQMATELPLAAARRLSALPLRRDGKHLMVALADPTDIRVLDELRFGTGAGVIECGALSGPLQTTLQALHELAAEDPKAKWRGGGIELAERRDEVGAFDLVTAQAEAQPEIAGAAMPLHAELQAGADAGLGATGAPPPAPGEGDGPCVLVVDDEADLRQLLSQYLTRVGFVVQLAVDGRQAMAMLGQRLPDAVVLDAMLPGVHGFDICRQIKSAEATRHLPVIMISAIYRGWRYADDVRQLYGADAFLEKPFRLDELKRAIERALEGREQAADNEQLSTQASQLLRLAARAYQAGDIEGAAQHMEKAVDAAPFIADLHRRLGLLYDQLKRPYHAIAALERAADLEPSYPHLVALARLYQGAGFSHKALEAWERCLYRCEDPTEAERIRAHIAQMLPAGR